MGAAASNAGCSEGRLRAHAGRGASAVPTPVARGTVGALFDREPVQLSLRGDAYLWRELRAQFATTPFPRTGTSCASSSKTA